MLINESLRGIEICRELRQLLLSGQHSGSVHSVFRSSLNVMVGEQLITLLAESRPLYPYSLRVSGEMLPGVQPGDEVALFPDKIVFPKGRQIILPEEMTETDLTLASLPFAGLCSPDDKRLAELRNIIFRHGKPDGFAPLLCLLEKTDDLIIPSNLYADFAAVRIPALFQAVQALRVAEAGECAYSIAGCGIGLTPSADDFLCGMMTSLQMESLLRGENGRIAALSAVMAKKTTSRTNRISGTFLSQAAAGLVSRDVRELMYALYSSVLSQGVYTSAMNVIAFGETSGTDILTGIYFGQKIYPN